MNETFYAKDFPRPAIVEDTSSQEIGYCRHLVG